MNLVNLCACDGEHTCSGGSREELKAALKDMIYLAGGLADDDWYYAEGREAGDRLRRAADVLGEDADVEKFLKDVIRNYDDD